MFRDQMERVQEEYLYRPGKTGRLLVEARKCLEACTELDREQAGVPPPEQNAERARRALGS